MREVYIMGATQCLMDQVPAVSNLQNYQPNEETLRRCATIFSKLAREYGEIPDGVNIETLGWQAVSYSLHEYSGRTYRNASHLSWEINLLRNLFTQNGMNWAVEAVVRSMKAHSALSGVLRVGTFASDMFYRIFLISYALDTLSNFITRCEQRQEALDNLALADFLNPGGSIASPGSGRPSNCNYGRHISEGLINKIAAIEKDQFESVLQDHPFVCGYYAHISNYQRMGDWFHYTCPNFETNDLYMNEPGEVGSLIVKKQNNGTYLVTINQGVSRNINHSGPGIPDPPPVTLPAGFESETLPPALANSRLISDRQKESLKHIHYIYDNQNFICDAIRQIERPSR